MKNMFVILFLVLILGCVPEGPVKIGFLGGMTGTNADLGISGRNGALLAVNEINAGGGIKGRSIELVIRDDQQKSEICRKVTKELIDEKVVAIVGPMTSDMSLAALPLVEKAEIPIVSPTASTPLLTGLDDYFLRVNPPDDSEAVTLAAYVAQLPNIETIVAIYSDDNLSFSEGLFTKFVSELNRLGQWTISKQVYSSAESVDYNRVARKVLSKNPDLLFFISNSLDTAQLCQQIKKLGARPRLIGTGWAMTDDLIAHGGSSVEGIIFSHYHNNNSKAPKFLAFRRKYYEIFKSEPDFIATLGYNALMVIAESARLKGWHDIKQAILDISHFDGLQGPLTIDSYGDAELSRHYISIKDGQFIDL